MKHLNKMIAIAIAACSVPLAYADINVTNHSRSVATADAIGTYHTSCSSFLGDAGIVKPNGGTVTIPSWSIGMACQPDCVVSIFMSKDCKAPKIAEATINSTSIKAINNIPNAEGYYVTKKSNNELTIEGGVKANIFDSMLRKLGL